jgi:hypothetical protein
MRDRKRESCFGNKSVLSKNGQNNHFFGPLLWDPYLERLLYIIGIYRSIKGPQKGPQKGPKKSKNDPFLWSFLCTNNQGESS